jgi:hypothetical protein
LLYAKSNTHSMLSGDKTSLASRNARAATTE